MISYELLAETPFYFRFAKRPTVETGPHFHRAVELLFAQEGTQEVVVGGQAHTLQPGQGCFCDAFCVHAYEKNERTASWYIVGDYRYFERFFANKNNQAPPKFFHFDNFALLAFLHDICNKNYQNDRDRYAAIEGCMHILLAEIAEKNTFVSQEKQSKDTLVKEVLLYAEQNFKDDLSLQSLCKKFSVSREHLSRLLHKHLTVNWSTYVGNLRALKTNAFMQNNPDLSVLDAAFMHGFDSANTFYRAYKRAFGKPPRALF